MKEHSNEQQQSKEQNQVSIENLLSCIREEIEDICDVKKAPFYVYDVTAFRLHQGLHNENWHTEDLEKLEGYVAIIVDWELVVSDVEFEGLDLIYKYGSFLNETEERKVTPHEEVNELLSKINTTIETLKTTDIEYFEGEDMFKLSKKAAELSQLALNVAIEIVDTNDKE